jgi:hypothetical protein
MDDLGQYPTIPGGPVYAVFPTVGSWTTFPIQSFSPISPSSTRPVTTSNRPNQQHPSPSPDLLSIASVVHIISSLANNMAMLNTTDDSDNNGTIENYSSSEEV